MYRRRIFTALTLVIFSAGLFLIAPAAYAEATVIVNEVDPGYSGDAPDTVDLAQTAPVLAPGRYGTTLVSESSAERVFSSPVLGKAGDKDVYKLTVFPGVLFKFKVTPHFRQNIAIDIYDQGGERIKAPHFTLRSYGNAWNKNAAGFAEELIYMHGLNLSHSEDGLTTFYVVVYDLTQSYVYPRDHDYSQSRYAIEYSEENKADGTWTVDAPEHLLRAPKVNWDQTYRGFIGYHDRFDCYQVDPEGHVGDKVTVTAKPISPGLDINIERSINFYDANAARISIGGNPLKTNIGNRQYEASELINIYNNGAKGFPNTVTIYPYYAKRQYSNSTEFVYVCVELKEGEGEYEFSIGTEAGTGTVLVPADLAGLVFPPEALLPPEPPDVRELIIPRVALFGDDFITLEFEGVEEEEEKEEPAPRTFGDYKIGDRIPANLKDDAVEARAKEIFKELFRKKPNVRQRGPRIFVETIAYGLQPKKVLRKREASATKVFRRFFKRDPTSVEDLAIVRAIAYSRLRVRVRR